MSDVFKTTDPKMNEGKLNILLISEVLKSLCNRASEVGEVLLGEQLFDILIF